MLVAKKTIAFSIKYSLSTVVLSILIGYDCSLKGKVLLIYIPLCY